MRSISTVSAHAHPDFHRRIRPTKRISLTRAACASVDAAPTRLLPAFTCASARRVRVGSMHVRYVARAPLLCIGYFGKLL